MPMATPDERTQAYKASFVPIQKLLDAGKFPDALAELERVTAANAECAQAHNDLAVLYHAGGRLTDADRESRRAVELDPFHADIRDNRDAIVVALGALAASTPGSAAATPAPPAMSALQSAPVYRDALRKAEELMAAGQLDAAVAEIERFVEREPATAEAWNDLGVLHRDGGRLRAAHAALVVALTVEPTNRQAAHNLTRVLLEMGRHQEALRTLEPTLIRDPRDAEALALAGDISIALGQTGDASAFYRAALAIDPSNVDLVIKLAGVDTTTSAPAATPASPPSFSSVPLPLPGPGRIALPAPAAHAESTRVLDYDPRVRLVTPDETYDAVTCKIPLDRLPNPILALTEMTRILRPGGKLWIDLGGPLEVIKHTAAPTAGADGNGLSPLPAARAR